MERGLRLRFGPNKLSRQYDGFRIEIQKKGGRCWTEQFFFFFSLLVFTLKNEKRLFYNFFDLINNNFLKRPLLHFGREQRKIFWF